MTYNERFKSIKYTKSQNMHKQKKKYYFFIFIDAVKN